MAKHELVFFSNRNTPLVIPAGSDYKSKVKDGYGKVVSKRAATAQEETTIGKGAWLRVDKKGNKPGDGKYKGGSNYRPQLRDKSDCAACERVFATEAGYDSHMTVMHRD